MSVQEGAVGGNPVYAANGGGSKLEPRPSTPPDTVDYDSVIDSLPKESRQLPPEEELVSDPEYVALHDKLRSLVPQCGVNFSFRNVSFHRMVKGEASGKTPSSTEDGDTKRQKSQKRRKDILVNVSGLVRPGEALAIMGASGAGKTMLLNALAGRLDNENLTGEILTNGTKISPQFKRVSKFVAHTDDLIPTLTVRETLMYAAQLQLPPTFSTEEKRRLVQYTIRDLGLEICQDTLVGGGFMRGISGGQRRRVVLGVELLTQPCVLFLDVPTSGLDSTAATVVMERIFTLCKHHGTSVISSIQAPSSDVFSKFDNVLLLWKGRVVYFGPPARADTFFAELNHPVPSLINPSDHFMNTINTDFEDGTTEEEVLQMVKHHEESPEYASLMRELEEIPNKFAPEDSKLPPGTKLYANNLLQQFWLLFKRNNLNNFRNVTVYWVRIGMYTLLSLVMGTLYLDIGFEESKVQDRISVLFFTVAFFTFMTIAALPAFIQERSIFVRERSNGSYQVISYLMASTFASLYWIFFISLLSAVCMYWLIGFHEGRFGYYLAMLFLGLLASESFVVAVSSLVPQFMVGLAVCSGLFGFWMLVSGFFLTTSNIPPYWVWGYYTAFHAYTFSGFLYNDLSGLTFTCDGSSTFPELCPTGTGTFTGEQVLQRYEINSDNRARDAGILVAMTVIFRIITYLFLRFFQKGKLK